MRPESAPPAAPSSSRSVSSLTVSFSSVSFFFRVFFAIFFTGGSSRRVLSDAVAERPVLFGDLDEVDEDVPRTHTGRREVPRDRGVQRLLLLERAARAHRDL